MTGERVHLRAGPGLSYEILLRLDKRARVEAVERHGDWYGVRLPEGVGVYVHRSLLEVMGTEGRVLGGRVQVRSGPGVHFSRMAALSKGDRVQVEGTDGDWVRIHPPESCRGWIRRDYVTFLQPLTADTDGGS